MEKGQKLYLTPKMGIIPEVTSQNYETLAKQLREAIVNSIDAGAKNVYVSIQPDGENTDLIISDDGIGMGEDTFINQFLALGGSDKYYDELMIGRIGIGFLACAPLCEYLEIHSRYKGSKTAYVAQLNTEQLLDRSHRLEEIKDFPVGEVIEVIEDADSIGLEEHYTTLYFKNLNRRTMETLNKDDDYFLLRDQLNKILPLKFPEGCKLFEIISDDLKEILMKVSDTWNIDVFFNGEKLIKKVYGEVGGENFKVVMEILNEKAEKGNGVVSGYLIDNYRKIKNWNGLITRFQNTTVEDSGWLGWIKKPAVLPRITGELFISGLDKNRAMSINRNSFNEGNEEYLSLRDLIYKKIEYFTSKHYRRTYISSAINREFKQKKAIKKNLVQISKAISKPKKKKPPIQKQITKRPIKKKKATDLSELIIEGRFGKVEVKPVDTVPKEGRSKKEYIIEWRGEDGTKPVVLVDKKALRESREDIILEGKKYKVFYIEDEDDPAPCKIDFEI